MVFVMLVCTDELDWRQTVVDQGRELTESLVPRHVGSVQAQLRSGECVDCRSRNQVPGQIS